MKNSHQNMNQQPKDDNLKSFPGIEINYARSKEEVWAALQVQIEQPWKTQHQIKKTSFNWMLVAAAAILILFLGTTTFAFLFTKTFQAPSGKHLAILLPDGSGVELNAKSVVRYKPYWWVLSREVQFEGEAFFKVRKGKTFEVVSSQGRTIVLGTSFNIYSRKDQYRVTCYTGKVKVVSVSSGESTEILPNEQAIVGKDGTVVRQTAEAPDHVISWMNDRFVFTRTPLNLVFEEIERQYSITIEMEGNTDYLYTGNFTRELSAEEVVRMVCLSLNLEYKKTPGGFIVAKKTDT